jgi:hypothetical protein
MAHTSITSGTPSRSLRAWRRERLVAAGFAPELASRLGDDPRTDLHALLDLVDRGCPPHLAARILAPFDHEDAT